MNKRTFNLTWIYLALLAVLTIPLCLMFFNDHLINAHDSMAGYIRAVSMEKYMGQGQFLVRWSPELNWGYGYPMFNFYPPFFSFICALFFQAAHNMVSAIDWSCALFWVLSGWGMFLWARAFWGDEGGMLSAVLYLYAPYHLVDLYIRGAFAEFSAFAFFPFFLLSILKISQKPGVGYFLLGVASIFGLSLTHNIMSMVFFPIAAAYAIYVSFFENKSACIVPMAAVFIIGLMLSAFFWLPALLEKEFLNLNFLLSMGYDFSKHFISLGELFWPWNAIKDYNGIYLQIGIIHTLVWLWSLAGLAHLLKINAKSAGSYIFFLVIAVLAILLTLPASTILWQNIPMLPWMQFPWRLLTIIVFILSFLGGSVALLVQNAMTRRIFLSVIALLAVLVSLKYYSRVSFVKNEVSVENFVALGEGEYTPKWITVPPAQRPDRKFEVARGNAQLDVEKALNPVNYETIVHSSGPSLVCFNTFYFPGWKVFVDEQAVKPYLNNPFGVILFYVPSGDHELQAVFESTPVRHAAAMISWLGVLLLAAAVTVFFLKPLLH